MLTEIVQQVVAPLCASLDRLSEAITNNSLLAVPGTRPPTLPVPEAPKRGRPAKIVSPDQLEPEPAPTPAEKVDYDKVLTDARTIAAELLQKDQQAKNSAYKDQLVTLWRELHPTGNGKLSGLPQEKLPAALERLKQIAA